LKQKGTIFKHFKQRNTRCKNDGQIILVPLKHNMHKLVWQTQPLKPWCSKPFLIIINV